MTLVIRPNSTGPATVSVDLDLEAEVKQVLEDAYKGNGLHQHYLTSYQIEAQLHSSTRRYLYHHHGESGKGAGQKGSAATMISRAAESLVKQGIAEKDYLDTSGLKFVIDGKECEAGFVVCAIFRLKRP